MTAPELWQEPTPPADLESMDWIADQFATDAMTSMDEVLDGFADDPVEKQVRRLVMGF